GIMQRLWKKRK
ncbi:homoserine kinase, partial [Helicobacter pylori]